MIALLRNYLTQSHITNSYHLAFPRWIEKHWAALDVQQKQTIVAKDVRVFLQRVNYKLSPKEIKDCFQAVWMPLLDTHISY